MIELDGSDVDQQARKLAGYGRTAKRHFSRAMGQSVVVLLADWKEIAPVLKGRYRGSLAGRVRVGQGPVQLAGSVSTNVWAEGFPYPAALEESRRFHYRGGPRRGQRTAGRVKGVLRSNTARINKFFQDALKRIIKRLVVK